MGDSRLRLGSVQKVVTKFVDDTNSDLGFGWHVLQQAHDEGEAV
ncbi:hypothetical protein ACFYRY_42805 [Streptomyces sp. NPDC005263]